MADPPATTDSPTLDTIRAVLDARGRGAASQLARDLGWPRGRLSHYLTGRRPPTIADVEAMAAALGLRVELRDRRGRRVIARPSSPRENLDGAAARSATRRP